MSVKEIVQVTKEVVLLVLATVYYGFLSLFLRLFPRSKRSLRGQCALVTGAGHGLGYNFALQLSDLGVKVICWDINEETCKKTAEKVKERGGEAWAFQCDVSDPKQIAKVAVVTRNTVGSKISLLFNNAGILEPCKPFIEQSPEEIQKIFRVNVYSQMYMVKEFYNDLLGSGQDKCHVIAMSSTAAHTGTPNMSTYCSTKYAVNGFMEAFVAELRRSGLDSRMLVTLVYPFTINTGLAKKPLSRFSKLIPFTDPDKAVTTILDGVRRGESQVFVPRRLELLFHIQHIFPITLKRKVIDFFGCGVERHKE